MSVSLAEFQYVYHNYREADDVVLSQKLSEAQRENNIVKLESILANSEAMAQEFPEKELQVKYHCNQGCLNGL